MVVLYYRSKDTSMTSRALTFDRRNSATVHPYPNPSSVVIVLGAQWGDEVRRSNAYWTNKRSIIFFREKAN